MMRTHLAALLCVSLIGCRGCRKSVDQPATSTDAGHGVVPIQVGAAPKALPDAGPSLKNDPIKKTKVSVLAWSFAPTKPRAIKPAEARARKALAQALAGYRYALTGDDQIRIKALATKPLPLHQIKSSRNLGLMEAQATTTATGRRGHHAMATGRIRIGKTKVTPKHTRSVMLDAMHRLVKQTRGSGIIYPTTITSPRVSKGILEIDLIALVLRDGEP